MFRELPRKLAASTLAAVLTLTSPGFQGYQAFAQVAQAPVAPVAPVVPGVSVPTALPMSGGAMIAPGTLSLSLPAPVLVAPTSLAAPALENNVAARALVSGAPALAKSGAVSAAPAGLASSKRRAAVAGVLAERSTTLSRELENAGPVAETSGEGASGLGSRVMDALFGVDLGAARPAVGFAAEEASSGKPGALSPAAPSGKSAETSATQPAAPAAKAASGTGAAGYGFARGALRSLAAGFGLSFSLPTADPALAERLIKEAASKSVVFSDYDDTLDKFAGVASPETVAPIVAALKAGKTVVVITDRPDAKKPGAKNVTILESLESIPAADRAGLWVASNKGGRILRYDASGEAKLVFEEPALPQEEAAKAKDAAEAVKARLAALGAEVHDGSKNIPSENASPYGYALMLKIGTQEPAVKAVAAAFQEELAKRGLEYEVEPRLAKDPAFPPYVTFSKLDKSVAVRRVAEMLKVQAADAMILGDSMFAPKPREVEGRRKRFLDAARKLGERLSGAPQPLTGNGTDRDMEKGLPGALTLSVGGTADPSMGNAFVLPGKGPEVTRRVLWSFAQGGKPAAPADSGDIPAAFAIPMIVAIVGAAALGWYALYSAIFEIARQGAEAIGPGGIAWPMLFGMAGMMTVVERELPDPNAVYGEAYKAAVKAAAELGSKGPLRFVEATANAPMREGKAWSFTFALPAAEGARTADLVSVDVAKLFGALAGPYDYRATVYRGAPMPTGSVLFDAQPYWLSAGVKRSPAEAGNQVLREVGGARGGWSVSLRVDERPVSGDKDFWYHFYDNAGSHVAVNARTSELLVVNAALREGSSSGLLSGLRRRVAGWLAPFGPLRNGWSERRAEPAPTVTDDEVLAAARSSASYKGRPWSQTEYNMALYTTADSLRTRGATEAQLELYFKTCAAAPIRGGSFNPWSGD